MNIKRAILLTVIFIGLIIIAPLCFRSDKAGKDIPPLNPEHLTEEYEFKDTKILWQIKEDEDKDEYTK